jgi:mono/diheme cytochrome c family protein
MKNLTSLYSLAVVCVVSLLMWSCGRADGEFTGSEYMPDMAHSIAYEANVNTYYYNNTWGSEEDYHQMAHPRKPVKGTVARGFVPFKYQNLEDFRSSDDETHAQLQENVRKMIMEDPEIKNPIRPESPEELKAILAKGAELYLVSCQVCHGAEGDGNGVLYNDGKGKYIAKPANFTSDAFLIAPDGQFINAIMHGKGKMQSHADKLTPDERWMVIHYIRELQAKKTGVEYNPMVSVNTAPSSVNESVVPEEVEPNEAHDHQEGHE